MPLTDRQQQTYNFLRVYVARHGVSPKLREIADHLGIQSRGTVHRYLSALADAGLIAVITDRARGIELLEADDGFRRFTLPLVGRIAAGLPIEAIPDHDEIDLSEFFVRPNRFVLKVVGESMIEAGILDGDMVVVEKASTARDGEIVVALIDNEEATLKFLKRNPDRSITLEPANHELKAMRYPANRVQIQGIVVGQFRAYR
ncbi:MAG: transcriptional repressor LexA [Acidiferrobacterales bacterium]